MYDDPTMGWSRWAHTIRVFTLNSGLFYIRPNERTIGLMDRITDRLNKNKEWDQVGAAWAKCVAGVEMTWGRSSCSGVRG